MIAKKVKIPMAGQCSSIGRELAWHTRGPGFYPQHCVNPSPEEVEAGGSGGQGHPHLLANRGYLRPCPKTKANISLKQRLRLLSSLTLRMLTGKRLDPPVADYRNMKVLTFKICMLEFHPLCGMK